MYAIIYLINESKFLSIQDVVAQDGETAGVAPQFKVNAKAAILIEAETGKVLFSYNENEPLPIASITKIMIMLLVMEAIDGGKITPKDTTTISPYATRMGGSQVYLKEGEVFTVEELLKAVAVHSANDASVALAEVIAGSEEAFVAMMNQKAQELKMKNTMFLDCTGLTDEGHYSTAYDISIMSRELLTKHPKIVHHTTIWHDTFRDGKFDLDNTNKLVKRYRGTTGLKTVFTNKAGFCLSASAERDGTKFISVILGSDSNDHRFSESARLLDFAFTNWESARIEKKDLEAGTIRIKKERIETLNENNITTWGWQMLILKECGYKIEPGDLPGNINQIIDSIKNLTKPFNNNLLNLILIDTLITIDLNDDKQIYSDFVKQINVSDASEVLCYDVYYKNIILHRLGEFDASDIEHFAKTLRRKGGFSMNKKQVFPDIRSTYLMMQLLNLKGEGKNYDTKR